MPTNHMTANPVKTVLTYVIVAAAASLLTLFLTGAFGKQRETGIVVSIDQQQELAAEFSRTWQRGPSEAEMRELINEYLREEIGYREARRLNLNADDPTVRRHSRAAFDALVRDSVTSDMLTDEMKQAYLDENADAFRVDNLTSFLQIFFDTNENPIGADVNARYLLGQLGNEAFPEDIEALGDPGTLPSNLENMSEPELAALFGVPFAVDLGSVPEKTWSGPLRSDKGSHLVYVQSRSEGRVPELAEVEYEVTDALLRQKQQEAIENTYLLLEDEYDVTVQTAIDPQ